MKNTDVNNRISYRFPIWCLVMSVLPVYHLHIPTLPTDVGSYTSKIKTNIFSHALTHSDSTSVNQKQLQDKLI